MKKTVYDFAEAIKQADEWYKPRELSNILKDAALHLAHLVQVYPEAVCTVQCAIKDACNFLDEIKEMEVEQ
jgi:hypothetical protein